MTKSRYSAQRSAKFLITDLFLFCLETLQINDAGEQDAGSYECVVSSGDNVETSPSAKLYVKGKQNWSHCPGTHAY